MTKESKMAALSLRNRETSPRRTTSEVAQMGLENFARAGLIVTVHSRLLDEIVLFVSDNARVAASETRRVFRAGDLEQQLSRGKIPATSASGLLNQKVA